MPFFRLLHSSGTALLGLLSPEANSTSAALAAVSSSIASAPSFSSEARHGLEVLENELGSVATVGSENGTWYGAFQKMEMETLQVGARILNQTSTHEDYQLFRAEDTVSWIVFFVIFAVLLFFDNFVLHGADDDRLSFARASAYSVFWLACAGAFNLYVWFARGPEDAFNWGTGYLLEWMLSVDNLFVFRSIFLTFKTPDSQKHKPLFWGIVGAIFFRMLFFAIEELLLHSFSFMYVLLGGFLVYTGVKIMVVDDDDEISPEDDPIIRKMTERLPYINYYAPKPLFFARVDEKERGRSSSKDSVGTSSDWETPRTRFDERAPLRATKLLVVVVCLEVTDVVFAVDSVSAIVAQIPDLFLAYTACVFAMLGLRATFFVVDELVKIFSLLSYGVAIILIFIGVKLCLKGYVHVPQGIVCAILVTTLAISIVASWFYEHCMKKEESQEDMLKQKKASIAEDSAGELASASP